MTDQLKQEIEEDFDERFIYDVNSPIHSDFKCSKVLKSFLSQAIDQARQEVLKEIKENLPEEWTEGTEDYNEGFNDYRDHVIDIINKLSEKLK